MTQLSYLNFVFNRIACILNPLSICLIKTSFYRGSESYTAGQIRCRTLSLGQLRLVALFLIAIPNISQAQVFETSAFFGDDAIHSIKISPNGKHLALNIPDGKNSYLLILRTSDRNRVGIFESEPNQLVDEIHWASNERIIFSTLRFREGFNTPFETGEIFAFDISNSNKMQLTRIRIRRPLFSISNIMPNDPHHIRLNGRGIHFRGLRKPSSNPESYLLNIEKRVGVSSFKSIDLGNTTDRVVSPFPYGKLYSNDAGVPQLAVSQTIDDVTKVAFKADSQWDDISYLVNGYSSQLSSFSFVRFNSLDEQFYYTTNGESGLKGLYLYDHKERQRKLLFEHSTLDVFPEDVVFASDNSTVLGVKILGEALDVSYFAEHPEVVLHQRLDASFPGELVKIVDSSVDGSKAVVGVFGSKQLGEFYLLDTESVRLERITARSSELSPALMADVTPFTIRAIDDQFIRGFVTTPQNTTGPISMVVIPHDGPLGARSTSLFDREAQFFAHHGFAVLHVNFRGSGGYGSSFIEAGVGEWGLKIIDDITAATKWAIQEGIALKDKVCIYGFGLGGYAALNSVARESELYRCAAGNSGFYDLTRLNESQQGQYYGGFDNLMRTVGDNEITLIEQSPIFNADKIAASVLIAHGKKDRIAPFFHAKSLRDALEAEGKDVEFIVGEREGHGFYSAESKIDFYDKLLEFISISLE